MLAIAGSAAISAAAAPASNDYAGMLRWRFIGPMRGGRTKALAGIPGDPYRFYIAAVNGGVWKTDDAGRTWTPIFDDQPVGSIGALAVSPSDPNIIYAGSGEGLQRPDLSVGDGIYKSRDAGITWTHLGLRDAQQIAGIAVDPTDPQRLFVAALGHPYGANAERGIYRSTDGGASFVRVLYKDENTGAFDVKIDPLHPSTIYATLWAARTAPWEAGPFEIAGSGLFKSIDGGTSWTQLSSGFPARVGRIEVGIAASNPQIVYTMVDAPSGCGVYRSEDAGAHFARANDELRVCERGSDLTTIAVDPADSAIVYVTNTSTYRSSDGGKTFTAIKGAPGGDDYQNIWINPLHREIIALTSDQGATISLNGGRTWSSWYNQSTAQMYHVAADDRFPYWVCGGQQESGSACVSSRGAWGEITERDWHPVGAEEYGYVAPDPRHPGVFFGGRVERFDEHTGQTQDVAPSPFRSSTYRIVRTEPLLFDPLDASALYFGANRVYVTRDGGAHWRAVSSDLTRSHPAVPAVIGPFERDDPQKGTHRGVLYALALSHVHRGTIWAGTDDGLVWITRNGGAQWRNITPAALTPWSKVSQIDASWFDDAGAYVAINRARLDDRHPYVYRTHDSGTHWSLAVAGLPNEPINAVREDPQRRGLLYAAGENGVYVSFDDGERWQSLQLNLPHTSVRDLIVHGNDLAIATHGRGFWILDDVEPLREVENTAEPAHLFAPAPAYRVRRDTNTDTQLQHEEPHGENPPDGAIIDYALGTDAHRVTIAIEDSRGQVVRRFASDDPVQAPLSGLDKPAYWERPPARVNTSAGMHRFIWDLREEAPRSPQYDLPISAVYRDTPRVPQGALVNPGRYTVLLMADGTKLQRPLTVRMDPRVSVSEPALAQQHAMAGDLVTLMDRVYEEIQTASARKNGTAEAALTDLHDRLAQLLDVVDGADAAPTAQALAAYHSLRREVLGTKP